MMIRTRDSKGVALVMALALVTLLSILVISYLGFMTVERKVTKDYSESVKSQDLAIGALQEIVSDLQAEIDAGSLQDPALIIGGQRLFLPSNPSCLQPRKIGYDGSEFGSDIIASLLPRTLVRVSRAEDPFYSSPPPGYVEEKLPVSRASDSPADSISAARWNRPGILGATVPKPFSDHLPDWVLVTRGGSRKCDVAEIEKLRASGDLDSNDEVLGRYAYVIYDEGALIDVNAAGYLSDSESEEFLDQQEGVSRAIRGRSNITQVDLTQIPGLAQEAVDALVEFRNKGSLEKERTKGKDKAFLRMGSDRESSGFLHFESGDSPLLGRQDLIRYLKELKDRNDIPDLGVLAYLGTFSRHVNAPVAQPAANSPQIPGYYGGSGAAVFSYHDNALKKNAVNPHLASVRYDADAAVEHYRDDGKVESYEVKAGDSLLSRRFSLAKLGWLTSSGPAPGISEKAILDCFGLTWDTSGQFPRWVYAHGDTSNILTLQEALIEQHREPDFFELLKAGILQGSLGKSPGPCNISANADLTGVTGLGFEGTPITDPDMHILQIGANMIDQFDADSFPTAIHFPISSFPGYSSELNEYFFSVYGIENIPYLYRLWNPAYVLNSTNVNGWWGFEFWNPHRIRSATQPSSERPEAYRIRAYGAAQTRWASQGYVPIPPELSPVVDYESPYMESVRHLVFADDGGKFLSNPMMVDTDDAPASENDSVNIVVGVPYPDTKMAGIHAGEVSRSDDMKATLELIGRTYWEPASRPVPGRPVSFVIQYKDPDGKWRPASLLSRQSAFYRNSFGVSSSPHGRWGRSSNSRPDGRTDRFSTNSTEHDAWTKNKTLMGSTTNWYTMRSALPTRSEGFYFGGDPSKPPSRAPMGLFTYNQSNRSVAATGLQAYYTDPDGVVRPADGFRQVLSGPHSGEGALLLEGGLTSSRRPVVLDRPFRSVAELGHVFRDLPFRSLDFFSASSADAALLDLFSLRDEPALVAGRVNLNSASETVLKAILCGAAKDPSNSASDLRAADAARIAGALAAAITNQPISDTSELVTRHANTLVNAYPDDEDEAPKSQAEGPVRALASVAGVRTWNLLIDIIAQSGSIPPNATRLDQFRMRGQKRLWLHIAIDRYSGKIVDQQLEVVYE